MPFIENFQEFVIRHGGYGVKVDGNWLFSDGAWACPSPIANQPDMYEPPTDLSELLKNQRAYHLSRLQRAETAFQNLKARLLEFPGNVNVSMQHLWHWDETEFGPEPSDADGKVWLTKLQSIVMERRETVKAIDAQISKLPSMVAQQKQAAETVDIERKRREKLFAFQQEIVGIEI